MSIFRAISIGACLLFVAWFAVFGGELFGPWLDDVEERIRLHRFLSECEPDAIYLTFYTRDSNLGQSYISVKVSFTTGKLTIKDGGFRLRRDLFWQPQVKGVFSTITFPLTHPPSFLAEGQISEIKKQLLAMPSVSQVIINNDSSRNECYVAFYRGSDLQVEHFLPGKAPSELKEICRIIGFSPIYDGWVNGR